ncbi:hypothetical protein BGZ96_004718, partial [Linnemannia gamsii]
MNSSHPDADASTCTTPHPGIWQRVRKTSKMAKLAIVGLAILAIINPVQADFGCPLDKYRCDSHCRSLGDGS